MNKRNKKDKPKKRRKGIDRYKLYKDFLSSNSFVKMAPVSRYKSVHSCAESLRLGLKMYGIRSIRISQCGNHVFLVRVDF